MFNLTSLLLLNYTTTKALNKNKNIYRLGTIKNQGQTSLQEGRTSSLQSVTLGLHFTATVMPVCSKTVPKNYSNAKGT